MGAQRKADAVNIKEPEHDRKNFGALRSVLAL